MPRRQEPFLPFHYYHIYNRGNNRESVFFEHENYLFFLRGMKTYLSPLLDFQAYCLLPTHYHLLARVKPVKEGQPFEVSKTSEGFPSNDSLMNCSSLVSSAMQKFLISYTKAMNKRYERVGSLFQSQFQSKLITGDDHLLQLCFYIHGNPVKDGLVSTPEAWEYSNYREWVGLRNGRLVDKRFIEENFSSGADYRKQMEEYLKVAKDQIE